ncbi:FAD-dependent oxidoreductase, partial [Nocardia tengchongensis]|uniref:FAD-dependent oxidoreductase n=1 Tax=Nocardia tengchongensis TaxID=2055889 RepID=UPI0036ACF2E2
MSTQIPETVAAESITDWSDEVDVVVAGFGIAGGCAAVEAATRGARVLVLERAGVAGGTTALAGGRRGDRRGHAATSDGEDVSLRRS